MIIMKMMIIIIIYYFLQDAPFVMHKKDHNSLHGNITNMKYEGFLIDVFNETMKRLGMRYRIYEVQSFGIPDKHGVWHGMVAELMTGVSFGTFSTVS